VQVCLCTFDLIIKVFTGIALGGGSAPALMPARARLASADIGVGGEPLAR
jgi:hypothetical protein